MAKDAYWFKHDSNAGRGLRMKKMQHKYDHWGKGVYWDVIEVLRDQEKYTFSASLEDLHFLADLIGVKDVERFMNWFTDCVLIGLFKVENDFFYSEVLVENMGKWETKKGNGGKGGRPPKNRTETELKPNRNRIKTESKANRKLIETESKANRNHKIIEDKIIEDNNTVVVSDFNSKIVGVINYLNKISNKSFTPSKENAKFISARLAEGYEAKDFKKVIDIKCKEWLGTDQEKYIRPETLFNPTKFQSYLNQNETPTITEAQRKGIEKFGEYMPVN